MQASTYFMTFPDFIWEREVSYLNQQDRKDIECYFSVPNIGVIAHEREILNAIKRLSTTGLPRLSVLLLCYHTTNQHIIPENVSSILDFLIHEGKKLGIDIELLKGVRFLKNLTHLDKKIVEKHGRILLFQKLFVGGKYIISPENCTEITKAIDENYIIYSENSSIGKIRSELYTFFETLLDLHQKHPTKEAIYEALDLSSEVTIEEEDLENENSVQEFFNRLEQKEETAILPTYIKYIWNRLSSSIFRKEIGEYPIGGIQDLSSKGNLDQMILSEFAHDDLYFINRILNNETLYVKREIPPLEHTKTKHFLIEIGIHSWGNPKIISFALCLALIKHKKFDADYFVTLCGDKAVSIDFRQSIDILHALQKVALAQNPIEGFVNYLNTLEDFQDQEVFLFINKNTYDSTEFKLFLSENTAKIYIIFVIGRYGKINVYRISTTQKILINTFHLQIDQLKKPIQKARKSIVNFEPTIFYPLIINGSYEEFVFNDHRYILKSGKTLLKNSCKYSVDYYPNHGFKILYRNINLGSQDLYALGELNSRLTLVGINLKNHKITFIDLESNQHKTATIRNSIIESEESNLYLFYYQSSFYLLENYHEHLYKINLNFNESLVSFEEIPYKDYENMHPEYSNSAYYLMHKNLKQIPNFYITNDKKIGFGKYVLLRNDSGYQIIGQKYQPENIALKFTRKNDYFEINNNQKIYIDKNGMLLIDDQINNQKIYIPLIINELMGIGTENYFYGNRYFYNENNSLEHLNIDEFEAQILEPFINTVLENANIKA